MLSRRHILIAVAVAPLFASAGRAAEEAAFTPAAFESAQKASRPILVHIRASWCPTCKAQAPILGKLESEAPYAGLLVLNVDFDTQKDVVRRFGARMQSTLIAFKGATETARSVGDTRPDSIAALVASTL